MEIFKGLYISRISQAEAPFVKYKIILFIVIFLFLEQYHVDYTSHYILYRHIHLLFHIPKKKILILKIKLEMDWNRAEVNPEGPLKIIEAEFPL